MLNPSTLKFLAGLNSDHYEYTSEGYSSAADFDSKFHGELLKTKFPVVRISALTYHPFSFCSDNEMPDRPGVYGCSMSEPRILHSFLDHLNLTYKYTRPGDRQYGRQMGNGSWNGHIGMILRGEADIAIGGITQTFTREKVTPFSTEVFADAYSLGLHIPQKIPEYLNIYRTFDSLIWILTILSVIICGLVAAFLLKYAPVSEDGEMAGAGEDSDQDDPKPKPLQIQRQLMTSMGMLLGQDIAGRNEETQSKGKLWSYIIFALAWQNAAGILTRVYSADLLAFMVQPSFFAMPTSIYEAITQTKGKFIYSLYDETVEPKLASLRNPIYKKAVEEGRFKKCTTRNCAEWKFNEEEFLILSSTIFMPDWLVQVDPATGRTPTFAQENWMRSSFGWPMAPNSLLKEPLDRLILRSTEMGIITKVIKEEFARKVDESVKEPLRPWVLRQETVDGEPSTGSSPSGNAEDRIVLGLNHFTGAFMVWGCGLVASVLAFMAEVAIARNRERDTDMDGVISLQLGEFD